MITFQRNTEGTKPINSFLSFFLHFSFFFCPDDTLPEKRLYGDVPGISIHPLFCCWPAFHPDDDATLANVFGLSSPATVLPPVSAIPRSRMIPDPSSRLYEIKFGGKKKNPSPNGGFGRLTSAHKQTNRRQENR